MRLVLLAGLLAVAGCALTPAERAAQVEAEVNEMIQVYGPACEKLGYKRDEDKWRGCILELSKKADQAYYRRPVTTTCVGHRGFYQCTAF